MTEQSVTEQHAEQSAKKFDDYASTYQDLHKENLSASGESTEYFSEYKLKCLERAGAPQEEPLLDYGCGIGNVTKTLAGHFTDIHGYDPSSQSLDVATRQVPRAKFHAELGTVPVGYFSTVVMSGVLHHIPPEARKGVLERVLTHLRPGGRLFVFEHNPINPLTQRVVATCPFDDDAIGCGSFDSTDQAASRSGCPSRVPSA